MFAATATDAYKVSHKGFMDPKTQFLYSNFTARSDKHLNLPGDMKTGRYVWFGLQAFIIDYMINEWNETFFDLPKEVAVKKLSRRFKNFFGYELDVHHFEQLHALGYLPLTVASLPEGSRVNIGVPAYIIVNTRADFAWLTNYVETVMSCEVWKPSTVATIADALYTLCEDYALKTTGDASGVIFQCHDFSFRGMSGRHDAALCGMGHLIPFRGTDTLPAIEYAEVYYSANSDKEFIGTSVPASEHSVTCLGSALMSEEEFFRKAITEQYPTGIVSLVSDSYDYWNVLTNIAVKLKPEIMARQPNALGLNKVVFRPDSGDPVEIICGTVQVVDVPSNFDVEDYARCDLRDMVVVKTPHGERGDEDVVGYYRQNGIVYEVKVEFFWNRYDKQYYYIDETTVMYVKEAALTPEQKGSIEVLWDNFGGTITEQGYKLLDPHVGLIYVDSITPQRAQEIFKRLEAKGFASTNVVFGVGSYTYNYNTRDSLGFAIKATWALVDGEEVAIYKDPKTDSGTKKSARGLLTVTKDGNNYVLNQLQTVDQTHSNNNQLEPVFCNGELVYKQTFEEIRARWARERAEQRK